MTASTLPPAGGQVPSAPLLVELLQRRHQAKVPDALAAQVSDALQILLTGFEDAERRDASSALEIALQHPPEGEHVFGGLLTVLLRLVFLLYAEERGLLLSDAPPLRAELSLLGLFEQLQADHDRHRERMSRRFGAWARLCALFRAVHDGAAAPGLRMPARRGRLFSPHAHPFLEGGLPGAAMPSHRRGDPAEVQVPSIDDLTVYSVLSRLIFLDGQRLCYRALDVEQLGSVYEALMGHRVVRGGPEAAGRLGRLVLQPGPERKHSGSHYTPPSLTELLVRRSLERLIDGLDGAPTADQLLGLKICDPAMGSGAFLLAACRQLADRVVVAWTREGRLEQIAGTRDPVITARRLVAQRCLYGVDENPLAVDLAKLSLWLEAAAVDQPFTFVDHALRHGDALVGLSAAQVRAFHWAASPRLEWCAETLTEELEAALTQRQRIAQRAATDTPAATREEELAMPRAKLLADLITGAFFAGSTDEERRRERERRLTAAQAWIEGGGEPPAELLEWQHSLRSTASAFHWELEFPEVFCVARPDAVQLADPTHATGEGSSAAPKPGGFDLILGNPPFLNAIEHARDPASRAYFALAFPEFAQGAYDLCLLFWARALGCLLSDRGRYGLLLPTALLSDGGAWKRWVHERWRPRSLCLYPVDFFPDARIRTTAVVGERGASSSVLVTSLDPEVPVQEQLRTWGDGALNWYEVASGVLTGGSPEAPGTEVVELREVAEVGAGCTTGDAYLLAPEIVDSVSADGAQLVTTGAIDRYACKWGEMTIRYLKRDYRHPRWPAPPSDPGVARALARQRGPKILVGGLTAVVEAWHDHAGVAAGVVQTWVVRPAFTASVARAWWLTGILNSAYFSRVFVSRHGGQAMSGRQITVKKSSLLSMIVPSPGASDLDEGGEFGTRPALEALADGPEHHRSWALGGLLARLAETLQRLPPGSADFAALDRLAHLTASALYGRSERDAEDDYRWWCARTRAKPSDAPWAELIASLLRVMRGSETQG